jgi:nucleoside-diphosphate-sugar epimerase
MNPPGTGRNRGRHRANLSRRETKEHPARGVSAVVHLAALFRTRDEGAIWRVNHQGTKNLIARPQHHRPRNPASPTTRTGARAVLRVHGHHNRTVSDKMRTIDHGSTVGSG